LAESRKHKAAKLLRRIPCIGRFEPRARNHNHEMKGIFKSAATRASCGRGPFHDFYAGLLAKGMNPEMARLTLARKIAAIPLTLWKKEERFDVEQLKTQAA
jgi:hypothetical protein